MMLTPTWIVSTVIVGLLLNVVSGYLKDGLDRMLSILFERWGRASARRSKARAEMVKLLRTDMEFQRSFRIKRLVDAHRAMTSGVGGIVVLVFAFGNTGGVSVTTNIALFYVGMLSAFAAQAYGVACVRKSILLVEAEAPSSPERFLGGLE
ncbi:hypothetical protein [Paraburkholderia hospita]|uniref:hypothetical protein n=1 Tax=Paraburkholderia hospita TaxID=169430 RepID=UPI003ECCE1D3